MGQECAKRMIARGEGGKIVSVSSTASLFALHDHAAYCASKAAINGLTQVKKHTTDETPVLVALHIDAGSFSFLERVQSVE